MWVKWLSRILLRSLTGIGLLLKLCATLISCLSHYSCKASSEKTLKDGKNAYSSFSSSAYSPTSSQQTRRLSVSPSPAFTSQKTAFTISSKTPWSCTFSSTTPQQAVCQCRQKQCARCCIWHRPWKYIDPPRLCYCIKYQSLWFLCRFYRDATNSIRSLAWCSWQPMWWSCSQL